MRVAFVLVLAAITASSTAPAAGRAGPARCCRRDAASGACSSSLGRLNGLCGTEGCNQALPSMTGSWPLGLPPSSLLTRPKDAPLFTSSSAQRFRARTAVLTKSFVPLHAIPGRLSSSGPNAVGGFEANMGTKARGVFTRQGDVGLYDRYEMTEYRLMQCRHTLSLTTPSNPRQPQRA